MRSPARSPSRPSTPSLPPPVRAARRPAARANGRADVVLVGDAQGRLSRRAEQLKAAGGAVSEEGEPCGVVYFTRHYRLEGAEPPPSRATATGDLDYLKYGRFPGDNGRFSITLGHPRGRAGAAPGGGRPRRVRRRLCAPARRRRLGRSGVQHAGEPGVRHGQSGEPLAPLHQRPAAGDRTAFRRRRQFWCAPTRSMAAAAPLRRWRRRSWAPCWTRPQTPVCVRGCTRPASRRPFAPSTKTCAARTAPPSAAPSTHRMRTGGQACGPGRKAELHLQTGCCWRCGLTLRCCARRCAGVQHAGPAG